MYIDTCHTSIWNYTSYLLNKTDATRSCKNVNYMYEYLAVVSDHIGVAYSGRIGSTVRFQFDQKLWRGITFHYITSASWAWWILNHGIKKDGLTFTKWTLPVHKRRTCTTRKLAKVMREVWRHLRSWRDLRWRGRPPPASPRPPPQSSCHPGWSWRVAVPLQDAITT